jgi:DNA-binding SARP family transcriptional activator/predicted ATPase
MHSPALLVFTSEKPSVAAAAPKESVQVRVDITLLGEFTVSVNGVVIEAGRWKFKHPRLLWQMLCLAPGHQVSRDEAAEALWPQAGVQASSNRLYHTLHTLRGIFSEAGVSDARQLVQLQGGTLRLDAGVVLDVDVQRFVQAVAAARACNGSPAALAHLECARAVQCGDFTLPASAGPWFAPHREALLRDRVWVLEQLAQRLRAAGRLDEAAQAGRALVQSEPSNEAAHRLLIELYDVQGRPDLAAQQYAACSRYLRRDRAAEPSPATRQLAQHISQRLASGPRTGAGGSNAQGLLVQRSAALQRATPLVGREAELAELEQCLLRDHARLITITAAGGIGKTRIAEALAARMQDHFRGGVLFVTLGAVRLPSRLAEHLCQALGINLPEQAAEPLLLNGLEGRRMLLVLDRFEHLVDAGPQLSKWLQALPQLHIVVTSQCALKSRAERVYELPALLARAPQAAVDLFVQTAVRAGVSADALRDEPAIRGVCERVGGNALAIELAAAQLSRVPLETLPTLLKQPLQWLVDEQHSSEPQHDSLRATIGWSVSLLTPEQARLLALVSVFASDFSVDDAQRVLGGAFDAAALPAMLRTLLDRHLLYRLGDSGHGAPGRFALADAVREHAQGVAPALPQWAPVRAAHAEHVIAVVADAAEQVRAGQSQQVHATYRAIVADIEPALRWQRAHAGRLPYLRACWQAAGLHGTYGAMRLAIDCLQDATAIAAQGRDESDQSAWCHYMLSRTQVLLGETAAAARTVRAARRLAQGSHDQRLLGLIGTWLATVLCSQVQLQPAIALMERVIRDSRRQGLTDQLASQYNVLASCLTTRGDYPAAAVAVGESLDCALGSNNPQALLWALVCAAEADIFRGQLERAETSLREIELLRGIGYSFESEFHIALMSFYLAYERCDFEAAMAPLAQARALCRTDMASRAILVDILHEFVLVETWRFGEVKLLRSLTEQQLSVGSPFSTIYPAAQCYRLALQLLEDDWPAILATIGRLRRVVRRSGNCLWAGWVAQAAVGAAQRLGLPEAADALATLSRHVLDSRGILPTPRQINTWRSLDVLRPLLQPVPAGSVPSDAVAMIERLPQELAKWCGLTREPRGLEAQRRLPHKLPKPARHASTASI